jgi:hypothetical protein
MKVVGLGLRLVLVSLDRETLDRVGGYFEYMGALPSCTRRFEDAEARTRDADGVLVFADDYPFDVALRFVLGLRTKVVVVVTADVARFRESLDGAGSSTNVLVLRRPAWGWKLVEAVRDGRVVEDD